MGFDVDFDSLLVSSIWYLEAFAAQFVRLYSSRETCKHWVERLMLFAASQVGVIIALLFADACLYVGCGNSIGKVD
jgi:hypothetical protein